MAFVLPEKLSPALCLYVQEVLDGLVQGFSRLPTDIQKHIEWIGMSYPGSVPLPVSCDSFNLEVKLSFDLWSHLKAVSQSVAWKVDVYGEKELRLRVAEEFRVHVLRLVENLSRELEKATEKTKQLLM